jgi:hypothetical protein
VVTDRDMHNFETILSIIGQQSTYSLVEAKVLFI